MRSTGPRPWDEREIHAFDAWNAETSATGPSVKASDPPAPALRPRSRQMQAAVAGRPVRPRPAGALRTVARKRRKARKTADQMLRLAGLLFIILAAMMAFGAALGSTLN